MDPSVSYITFLMIYQSSISHIVKIRWVMMFFSMWNDDKLLLIGFFFV